MSKNEEPEIVVSIDEWVDKAKADPEAYLERQATEIFLTTLGTTQPYCQKFFLKGGLLMGIVYDSPRQTVDIDFSTDLKPDTEIAEQLRAALNDSFPATTARLGYLDIVCQVQTIEFRPREAGFENMTSPAFKITIGYARRGTAQEKRLAERNAAKVLRADISFNEPVGAIQIVRLGEHGAAISAYALTCAAVKKKTKRYRYYVSTQAVKKSYADSDLRTVSATLLENVIVDQMRRLLSRPEWTKKVLANPQWGDISDPQMEQKIIRALENFEQLWDELFPVEQERLVKLLIQRVVVTTTKVSIELRPVGMLGLVEVIGNQFPSRSLQAMLHHIQHR